MKLTEREVSALFGMTPEAALRWLDKKGYRINTADVAAMSATDHAIGFGFANLARLDIAQDIVNGLRDALANGKTAQQFADDLTPVLRKKGWWGTKEHINYETGEITRKQLGTPARLNTIFRTTTQGAYMAGRYESMIANAKERPYWRYVAVMDARTRPSHARLHNKVFHYLDPIWKFIFPPNGFSCRCRVEALTAAEVAQYGLVVSETEREVVQQIATGQDENGRLIFTPVNGVEFIDTDGKRVSFFPDVGFDTNSARTVFRANLDKYDPELARPYVRAGLAGPELEEMRRAAAAGEQNGDMLAAAVLNDAQSRSLGLTSKTVWLTEHGLAAQLRAGTLPAAKELPAVQDVIESPVITAKHSDGLAFYRPRPEGGWYCVTLDNSQNITNFYTLSASELAPALWGADIVSDAR